MAVINRDTIEAIKKEFQQRIAKAVDLAQLEFIRIQFLGRKSQLNEILKELKNLPLELKKEIGDLANTVRQEIEAEFNKKKTEIESSADFDRDWIDVTAPGKKPAIGKINILAQTQREIESIFTAMGFEIADGPELEDEWHNFTALNMPADHPARDMQDTFWLKHKTTSLAGDRKRKEEELKLLARTQTSNVQIRYMESHVPPVRIIVPGRVFRNESTDARHLFTFHQFEALVVDKEISVANFKDIAKKFFDAFFDADLEIRLRPSYFPFTEPSFEFDVTCACGGSGCAACKGTGWLEIGGAGMVNQRVFEYAGYKRNEYQGFAWGFGIERLAMIKHGITDGRLFTSGDLRFIRQF